MKLEQGKWYETACGSRAFVELIRDWLSESCTAKCVGFREPEKGIRLHCTWNLYGESSPILKRAADDIVAEWHESVEATVTVYLYESTLGDTFATTAISTGKPIGKKTVTVREGDGMDTETGERPG